MADWVKYALTVAGALILILLGQYVRSIENDLNDAKDKSKRQWNQFAETERCLRDKLTELKAEIAEHKGYHKGLREREGQTCRTHNGSD